MKQLLQLSGLFDRLRDYMNLRLVPICVLSLILLSGTGCLDARAALEGSFDRTLSVSGTVDLDVSTGSGSIHVKTGDGTTVRVNGLIRARDDFQARADEKVRYLQSNPPIEQAGNVIRIGQIQDSRYRNNVSISYEIVVPPDTHLRSKTGSGQQSVDGIRGPAEVSTGSGNLTVSNVGGGLIARTGSGRIDLDAIKGRVEAHTGSGRIQASGIEGAFKADTGSGGVTMGQTAPGDVEVSAGSGNLEVSGVKGALRARTGSGHISAGGEPVGEWDLHTSSGGVTVRLNSAAAFDLDARTSSGRITVNHPLTVMGTVSPKATRGKVRGGGALLNLTTGSGNITVE